MINGIDFSTAGVARVRVARKWLNPSGRLPVCIAKPPRRLDEIANDGIAVGTSDFARRILEVGQNGASEVQKWFQGEAGLLVFPEYAFSSQEFAGLDECVRSHPSALMVLAGFGAVETLQLEELLQNGCLAGWPDNQPLAASSRYNVGWCWIHDSPGKTRCVLFGKNFIEQGPEIAIPNLRNRQSILCIETDDAVIYPLICSDLISQEPNSPRWRIAQSLQSLIGKRSLICTLSCNDTPADDRWKTAIDDVVQMQQNKAVLLFANQPVASPHAEEEGDKWRCLTGAFVNRARMPNSPKLPLAAMRYVLTPAAAGLVFRHPDEGIADGQIDWSHANPATGRFVWQPGSRLAWNNGQFAELDGNVDFYETRRYVERRSRLIVADFAESTRGTLIATLNELVAQNDLGQVTPRLWPELIDGLQPVEPQRSADQMYLDQDSLDQAFGVFAAVQVATNGQTIAAGQGRGQMDWEGKDIRIWHSPRLREGQMLNECEALALEGGSMPPLVVVGRGSGVGVAVPAQIVSPVKALPDRQTDITVAMGDEGGDIESTRLRTVFWQHSGVLEQVLTDAGGDFTPQILEAITPPLDIA